MFFLDFISQGVNLEQSNGNETLKFALDYVGIPIILPIIVFLFKYIFFDKLIRVKEIKKATDADIEEFKLLYNNRINESLRIDAEEIVRFVGHNQNSSIEHHLLICKKWEKVIGFIKFMISKDLHYIFVAYIAIDKNDKTARELGAATLIKSMVKRYFKPHIASCIITEIEQKSDGSYKTALSKIISRYAKLQKKTAYYIDVPYIQPNMPNEERTKIEEDFLSLIYIPYNTPDNLVISKNRVLEIVESIYMQIYSPSCNEVACNCAAYNEYLSRLLNDYRSSIRECINLITI